MFRRNFRIRRDVNLEDPLVEAAIIDFPTSIAIFQDEYMRDDWSQRTLEFHLENMSIFIKFVRLSTSINNINSINPDILEDYVRSMRHAKKKTNTINGRIKTLRVFYRVLHESGYISSNPAVGLKTIKGPKADINPFTDEQVRKLLMQPDRNTFTGLRDYLIMNLFLDTGIRLDELINLRVSDINIKDCSAFVRKGKGNKSRTVFFGKDTRKELVNYLRLTKGEGKEYLLLNQDGNPIKARTVQDNIARYARTGNITGVRSSPHTFRHTFAKMFLMNDGDPYVLRDLLGHNSMSTVILYLKLFRKDLQQKYKGKSPVDNINSVRNRPPSVPLDWLYDAEQQPGNQIN